MVIVAWKQPLEGNSYKHEGTNYTHKGNKSKMKLCFN
jgi:hypothetical protein